MDLIMATVQFVFDTAPAEERGCLHPCEAEFVTRG